MSALSTFSYVLPREKTEYVTSRGALVRTSVDLWYTMASVTDMLRRNCCIVYDVC